MSDAYVVRSERLAHESIDGETIVIDLRQGTYYRLEGAASVAWDHLTAGASVDGLSRRLSESFIGEPAEVAGQAARFVAELAELELIVPHAADAARPSPTPIAPRAPFPGLAIHRFTDLQELFLIDPVHEVDDTGWPTAKPRS